MLDTIAFAIPGAGVHTITVASDLPVIDDPLMIDGWTQPGFAGTPLIELTRPSRRATSDSASAAAAALSAAW